MTEARWEYLNADQQAAFGNGCGPASIARWVPEFTFNGACRKHDFGYRIYGPLRAKLGHDATMLADCIVSTAGKGLSRVPLIAVALLYWFYLLVSSPQYVWIARRITGCKARSLEDMAARYGFTIDREHVAEVMAAEAAAREARRVSL